MPKKKKYLVLDGEVAEAYRSKEIKKTFHVKDLNPIKPKTPAQEEVFHSWNNDKNLLLKGSAGSGKTLVGMFLALREVLDPDSPYRQLICIKSAVPTRDIGFLPGEESEKVAVYEESFRSICNDLFSFKKSYDNLKKSGYVRFLTTSFIRGLTFDNAIIIFDEIQNASFAELSTVVTRVGYDCKIIFCGDTRQNDLIYKRNDVSGLPAFIRVIEEMRSFNVINFTVEDVVRSGIVKEFLLAREKLGI